MKKLGGALLVVLIVVAVVAIATGCLSQFWPTGQASKVAVNYAGRDPNNFKWPISTVGNLEKLQQDIEKSYLDNHTMLQAKLSIDEGTYTLAKNEIGVKVQVAKEQYQSVVGTYSQPGWGLTILLGLLGVAGTKKYANATMYSEVEHQAAIAKANNNSSTKVT